MRGSTTGEASGNHLPDWVEILPLREHHMMILLVWRSLACNIHKLRRHFPVSNIEKMWHLLCEPKIKSPKVRAGQM